MMSILTRWRMYWSLTKSLQTGLLLVTGLAGYFSARCPWHSNALVMALGVTLYLAIAGSTILNMVWDRDIDAKMSRACQRPLPAGRISVREATVLGVSMSLIGVGGAWLLQPLYGAIVFTGWFFDVVVYTMWLKRRTPWSIVWGGMAGAMPILAGRALGTGQIDVIGLLLALAILFWIPTHILTFGIKYAEQYRAAGIPIFPTAYGEWFTRIMVGLSTAAAVVAMLLAAWHIRIPWNYFHIVLWLSGALLGVTLLSALHRSPKLNFALYKFASVYMLGAMLLIMLGVWN